MTTEYQIHGLVRDSVVKTTNAAVAAQYADDYKITAETRQ